MSSAARRLSTPCDVGAGAAKPGARAISLNARTGLGPRVIERTRPSAATKAAAPVSLRNREKTAQALACEPDDVLERAGDELFDQASHSAVSSRSRICTRGQRKAVAKSSAKKSSSRLSGTRIVSPS